MKKYQEIGLLITIVCCIPQISLSEIRPLKWTKKCWSQLLPAQKQNTTSGEQEQGHSHQFKFKEIHSNATQSQRSKQTSFQNPLSNLSRLYSQSQNLFVEVMQKIENFLDPSMDNIRYTAATFLVDKLFGPFSRDPLAETLRKSLITDFETRKIIKPLERHINRLFDQIENIKNTKMGNIIHSQVDIEDIMIQNKEDPITYLHRYLIRILLDIVWVHKAADHVFVQESMALIERMNTPRSLIRAIGVFEQAILYIRKIGKYGNSQEMKKAIDIVLGQDPYIQVVLRNSNLIEPSFEQTKAKVFNQEIQLILYAHIHLGRQINQIAKKLNFQSTSRSVQDLREELTKISPFLSEIPGILNEMQFLEEVVQTSSENLISLFETESKEVLESLFDHINDILQARPLTHIENVFVLELIKAMALGDIQHPFIKESIEKFVDWPTDIQQSDTREIWHHSIYSTVLHRTAVLQQVHRYYQDVLHGRADYTQLLDMVLNMGAEATSNHKVTPFAVVRGL